MTPRRGDVWWVRLDPTLGSEISKTRPCLILSGDILNERRRTVVVVPLSSSPHAQPPLLVPVRCDGRDVVAVTDQIRAVSKQRLDRRLGTLSAEHLDAVEQGVRGVLELDGETPAPPGRHVALPSSRSARSPTR
jgi:mRNA interferase MazF